MIYKNILFLIFIFPHICFCEDNSSNDLSQEKQKIISSKNVLKFFFKKYKDINIKEEKEGIISFDFIDTLNTNYKKNKELILAILKDLVFDENSEIIKHNLKLIPHEPKFIIFRTIIIYKLASSSNNNFNDILLNFYYNKILNNKKISSSPKEKFLWACKHNSFLLPKDAKILKVTEKNKSNNLFDLEITYSKSSMVFSKIFSLKEYIKKKEAFWIPVNAKYL